MRWTRADTRSAASARGLPQPDWSRLEALPSDWLWIEEVDSDRFRGGLGDVGSWDWLSILASETFLSPDWSGFETIGI